MAQAKYNIRLIEADSLQRFKTTDTAVVKSFNINSAFKAFENRIELHLYSLDDILLDSFDNYSDQKFLQGSQKDNDGGVTEMVIDPLNDIVSRGYTDGDLKLVYNFLDDLYTENKLPVRFFIEEISPDRTEIRLLSTEASDEVLENATTKLKEDLESSSYLQDFRLNFGGNQLVIALNVDTQPYRDFTSIVIKLYQPLPFEFGEKSLCTIDTLVSDSVAYEITGDIIPDEITIPYLQGPNFNIEEEKEVINSTEYFSYNDLFDFPINETYRELNSLFKEKSIDLSIDYSDISSYVHFSSAEERLKNFQYKLNLITSYQNSYTDTGSGASSGVSAGTLAHYSASIKTIIDNFDHYERFLYYGSGSYSWPKQSYTSKPYMVETGSATGSWYTDNILSASNFDAENQSKLSTITPTFIIDDSNNNSFVTFTDMLGQHFDNLWIYSKAMSDKYDADNRSGVGVPDGLVEEALRNFGVRLYNSNRGIEDLFKAYTGQLYDTGSELVNTFTSASDNVTSEEKYRTEVYKRMYHNLPLLLKSKGTERGVKALIASFGIPTHNNYTGASGTHNGLIVRTVGGSLVDSASNAANNTPNLGPYVDFTSSLGKVRIDNTGSIEGTTLSSYISIVKQDKKYSDDLHNTEVGFSPTHIVDDEINDYFIASQSGDFNIDDFLGDPGYRYSGSYTELANSASAILGDLLTGSSYTQNTNANYIISGSHNYNDLVRIHKFYDNVLFKSIKDFVPARTSLSSGIIIKPHVLERSKYKQIQISGSQQQTVETTSVQGNIALTSSIEILDLTGSSGGHFGNIVSTELANPLTASYSASVMTPDGERIKTYHEHEEARYDGELSGSNIKPNFYPGELNKANVYKYENPDELKYKLKTAGYGIDPSPSVTPSHTVTPTLTPTPSVTATPPVPSPSKTPPASPAPTADCYLWEQVNCATGTSGSARYIHSINACSGPISAGCIQLGTFVRARLSSDGINCDGGIVVLKQTSTSTSAQTPTAFMLDGNKHYTTYPNACNDHSGINC